MSATRPHRKLVKHYHEPGDLHELTFSCYKRQPLLTNDVWRQQLARCIDTAGDEFEMRLARVPLAPPVLLLIEGCTKCLNLVFQRFNLPTMSATRPHRKLVKHYHEPGDLHELTFSCYKRQPLLTNDVWRQQLARCIDTAGDEFEMRLARVPLAPPVLFLIEGLHEMLESGHPTIEPATDVCH